MRHAHGFGAGCVCVGIALARPAVAQAPQAATDVAAPAPPPASAPAAAPPPAVTDPPPVVTAPPVVTQTAPQPAAAEPVAGTASPETTLQVFAEQERASRVAGSIGGLAIGAGLITGGVIADTAYDKSYGPALWGVGIGVVVASGIGLFACGPMESLAKSHASAPPDTLKRIWADEATKARMGRHIGGGISLGLGAVAAGAGAAIAAGAGDLNQEAREDWTTGLLLASGGLIGGGLAAFLMETHIEQGFRAAYGQLSPAPITVGAAPTPGGGSFVVSGQF